MITEPLSSPPPTSASPENDTLKTRPEKSKSIPPKPNTSTFKEFRPEKKEKVDVDDLRLSYDKSSVPDTVKEKPPNGHSKRNPSRNRGRPDKVLPPMVSEFILTNNAS
jgi:hypothetical protein